MKDWKSIVVVLTAVSLIILLIPTLLVLPSLGKDENGELQEDLPKQEESEWTALLNDPAVEVAVYRTGSEEIEKFPLEQYIVGVVASEMPAEFELEALKAQAVAARTYVVRQLNQGNTESLPEGAVVSDSVSHQVFKSEAELKKQWGSEFEEKINKIRQAVAETAGQVITYDGKPIDASFFSTSNGFTENSEDYWENEIPYLRSVESPWDKDSPKFTQEKTFKVQEFEEKLGVKVTSEDIGTVLSRTEGERIEQIKIGGKVFTGREVREKLDLASSDFSWVMRGDEIIVKTEGFGHGVGMSQYGANGMAKEGKTYQDIVKHYYKDVTIAEAEPFLKQYMVKK
ncbi:stage II sporulation protein D [Bacillus litorisediminis]|uniref:stage II sporulation protein D n=1 Tax=Bacillus litorisediminis TaxID=2922713 RepID=UPI001FAB9ADA|nr:stage II sporulation protein D [Bacillus litorisediminis]